MARQRRATSVMARLARQMTSSTASACRCWLSGMIEDPVHIKAATDLSGIQVGSRGLGSLQPYGLVRSRCSTWARPRAKPR